MVRQRSLTATCGVLAALMLAPSAALADREIGRQTVSDATGGATASAELWQRRSDGATYVKVSVADTRADGICAHAAISWAHENGQTYMDYGTWVCGAGLTNGPLVKPVRNWTNYRSVSLVAFVDGGAWATAPLRDFHAAPPHWPAADAPAAPAKPKVTRGDEGCRRVEEDQALTASYRGASELREPTPPWWGSGNRPTGVPAEQVIDVDGFEIGSVTVGAATCLTAKGWRLLSPIDVDVRSQGLTTIEGTNVRNSDVRARNHGLSRGWGLGIQSRHRGRLDIRFFECEESKFWDTVGVATNIPIPKIDIRWEIVRFAVGLLLPDDTATCGDFGIAELHVFPDRNGRLVLAPGRDRTRTHRAALAAGRSERVYAEPRPTVRAAHPDPPPTVKD